MISTTRGIVLHFINYSESSVIARVYTEGFGRISLMINNIRGRKTKFSINMIQPLSMIEAEIYHKGNRDIQRVREMSNYIQYQSIPYRIEKSTQAMFMAEILTKTLREEEANVRMYDFLENAFKVFDLQERSVGNFHLIFMLELTKHLGFYPRTNFNEEECFFDLRNGYFTGLPISHPDYLDKNLSSALAKILDVNMKDAESLKVESGLRARMLEALIDYYGLHNQDFGKIKSLPVLREILN